MTEKKKRSTKKMSKRDRVSSPEADPSQPKQKPPESAENFEHVIRRLVIERDNLRKK